MPLAQCRGCGAAIVWVRMRESGRAMPCDEEILTEWLDDTAGKAASTRTLITEDGVAITGRRGSVLDPNVREVTGRVPHWASCPQAGAFRARAGAPRG